MSNDVGNKSSQRNGAKRGFIILIALLLIIVVLVAVIAFLLGRKTSAPEDQSSNNTETINREVAGSARVILDQESAEDVMEDMHKQVEEGMFECNMSMTWTFEDGTSESKDAYVLNSKNNKYPIYFDVTLNDTGEQLYSSPVIPVGADLDNIKLDKDLDPGTYKATVMYTLIRDEQSQEVISSAGFVIKIIVNN